MSMVKRKENMVKSKAILSMRQMVIYEWSIKVSVMLNPPLH
jgi:hypothetical protein